MKKIIEGFNSLSDQVRYAILTAVVLSIIFLDVFFLVLPQMASITSVNDQVRKLSNDTQQVVVDKEQFNLLKKNLRRVRAQFKSLNVKIRTPQEVPVIISTISSIANEYGVKIEELTPEKSQQEVLQATADGKYYALPIVIKAHAGYHMFGRFLNKLENENLYVLLKDFIIQNSDKDPGTHSFSLTIKIILVDRSDRTVPVAKPKKR